MSKFGRRVQPVVKSKTIMLYYWVSATVWNRFCDRINYVYY